MNVLAIAPHPDDEVIGAGGSLARHVADGAHVEAVVVVAREPSLGGAWTADQYRLEWQRAWSELGIDAGHILNAPSRGLLPSRDLRISIARHIRRLNPQVVYIPHGGEDDTEHRLVHDLAIDALHMATSDFFPEAGAARARPPEFVLAYEVWTTLPAPRYYQDISPFVGVKLRAIRAFRSQLANVRWDRASLGLARYRGGVSGFRYAEAFDVVQLRSAALRSWA